MPAGDSHSGAQDRQYSDSVCLRRRMAASVRHPRRAIAPPRIKKISAFALLVILLRGRSSLRSANLTD